MDGSSKSSTMRESLVNLVSPSSPFDRFILVAIVLNSIALACIDYRHVDDNYQPRTDTSVRNNFIEKAEFIFTAIFTLECLLKCAAFGFWKGKRAYLKDGWNVLDFVIVILSILGLLPNAPNFTMLRSFRVLRPLRSISRLPNLRKIIGGFIGSLPELANVMVLLLFILVCFALFGVTFWRGLFHSRCRLTPFPVKMADDCRDASQPCWEQFMIDVVTNPESHRCLDDSLWLASGPQDCIWPIDEDDSRVCSLDFQGDHSCIKPVEYMSMNVTRTCGSNYNSNGSPRFVSSVEPYGFDRMQSDVFNSDFDWGFTNFDDFGSAFMTSFQILTMEGWSDIMYRTIDAWSKAPTILAYVLMLLLGSHLAINITLAVISGSLDDVKPDKSKDIQEDDGKSSKTKFRDSRSPLITHVQWLVKTKKYEYFMLSIIVLNTIVLSCDHYGISKEFLDVLETANYFTTAVFCIDMVLWNIAVGMLTYWSTPSTLFDGVIAVASAAELVVTSFGASGNEKSVISVFRSLRLVRLFKMLRSWESLHLLLNTINRAAADVRSFGVLLSLFIFTYALVGMQLFANRLHFDPETGVHISIGDPKYNTSDVITRHNFDTMSAAATTVFQVLSGENWNEVIYDCWKAASWISPLYFLSLVVLGVFIVLNLFLAILLRQFDSDEDDDESQRHLLPQTDSSDESDRSTSLLRNTLKEWIDYLMNRLISIVGRCNSCRRLQHQCETLVKDKRFDSVLTAVIVLSSVTLAFDNPLSDPSTPFATFLDFLNYIFALIFTYEFAIKIAALGPAAYFLDTWNLLDFSAVAASTLEILNVGRGKSLRALRTLRVLRPLKMMNRLPEIRLVVDALLSSLPSVVNVGAICGVLFLTFAIFGVTFLKGSFYECNGAMLTTDQMEMVTYPIAFKSFTDSQMAWLNVNINECDIKDWAPDYVPSSKELCRCLGSEWGPIIPQNFDNVLRGFALLFEISTTEGWTDVMYASIDQRGTDMQPIRGNNEIWAAYYIVFLLLGAFFVLELFVGVIVENFSRMKELKGCGLMTAAQREWALAQSFVMKIKPERRFARPTAKPRRALYDLATSRWFDRFIVVVILLNTACIAAAKFGDGEVKTRAFELVNVVCSIIFIIEAFIRIFALGAAYFYSKWNRFDLSIVLGLIIGFILKLTIDDPQLAASISSIVSLLRIGRIVRLIRLVKSLRTIVNSMIIALPGILNIGGLLLLLFFVYAVIGVQMYGLIGFQGELNEHANFRDLGNAMLLLVRFSTGENWNGFMWALVEERPGCDPYPVYNETSPWCLKDKDYPNCTVVNGCSADSSVFLFFYSFVLIVGLVALNMFVGVVLEAFENSQESDILSPADLDHFVHVWSEFDPNATNYMRASMISAFLTRLRPPLGIASEKDTKAESIGKDTLYLKDQSLLEIAVNEKKEVHIINVARQVAERLVKAKQGDSFRDLSDDHPIHRKAMKQREEMKQTLGDVYMSDARIILKAVRRFRQNIARRRTNRVYPERAESHIVAVSK